MVCDCFVFEPKVLFLLIIVLTLRVVIVARIIFGCLFYSIIVVGSWIFVIALERIVVRVVVIIKFGGLFGVNLTFIGALLMLLIVIVIFIGIVVPLSH